MSRQIESTPYTYLNYYNTLNYGTTVLLITNGIMTIYQGHPITQMTSQLYRYGFFHESIYISSTFKNNRIAVTNFGDSCNYKMVATINDHCSSHLNGT
ncbi:hypothetical protein GDO81_011571 [Engystomops pustulosus]|uniref:Uncharacterized protein n=1 Tax=Engystomops pustulosus TaxID=76066 RepID=A0AAV7BFG6_ENGPU|nr:hypothetical protein GDO81_011571 [Engystomops pustulosus]